MLHGDVADQLHQGDGLAHAGAAEQADLAALDDGHDQVDDLDAGLQDLGGGAWSSNLGAMRWMGQRSSDATGPFSSTGSPRTSMMRPSVAVPTGTLMGAPVPSPRRPRRRPIGRAHGDGAHDAVAELLLYLQRKTDLVDLRAS